MILYFVHLFTYLSYSFIILLFLLIKNYQSSFIKLIFDKIEEDKITKLETIIYDILPDFVYGVNISSYEDFTEFRVDCLNLDYHLNHIETLFNSIYKHCDISEYYRYLSYSTPVYSDVRTIISIILIFITFLTIFLNRYYSKYKIDKKILISSILSFIFTFIFITLAEKKIHLISIIFNYGGNSLIYKILLFKVSMYIILLYWFDVIVLLLRK